mmetsp:Transcript_173249/g.555691  ORF Transcript_173249/g.555691 Transcript_173249/m.555691 type:complete len:100 (-) Transcript_173249:4519-4818(-)
MTSKDARWPAMTRAGPWRAPGGNGSTPEPEAVDKLALKVSYTWRSCTMMQTLVEVVVVLEADEDVVVNDVDEKLNVVVDLVVVVLEIDVVEVVLVLVVV